MWIPCTHIHMGSSPYAAMAAKMETERFSQAKRSHEKLMHVYCANVIAFWWFPCDFVLYVAGAAFYLFWTEHVFHLVRPPRGGGCEVQMRWNACTNRQLFADPNDNIPLLFTAFKSCFRVLFIRAAAEQCECYSHCDSSFLSLRLRCVRFISVFFGWTVRIARYFLTLRAIIREKFIFSKPVNMVKWLITQQYSKWTQQLITLAVEDGYGKKVRPREWEYRKWLTMNKSSFVVVFTN